MTLGTLPTPAAATAALDFKPPVFRQPAASARVSEADAMRIGREFEAMFLSQVLQPIFDMIPTDPILGGGNGEKMFRSMQVDEYAKFMTKAGGIGIADAVQREILRMQEKAHAPN